MTELKKRYLTKYQTMVDQSIAQMRSRFPKEAYSGIPQIFLPSYGKTFETAPCKICFIGQDARGWGKLSDLFDNSEIESEKFMKELLPFESIGKIDGKECHERKINTFWGFVVFLLSRLYYGQKYEDLKPENDPSGILTSFAYGNLNSMMLDSSMEKYAKKAINRGALYAAQEATLEFNKYSLLETIFEFDVVFILSGSRIKDYLGVDDEFPDGIGKPVDVYHKNGAIILRSYHPCYISRCFGGYDGLEKVAEEMKNILQKNNIDLTLKKN